MTPRELEVRLAERRDRVTVEAVLAELHGDPDWMVTEISVAHRLAQADLVYVPTGMGYTMTPEPAGRRDEHSADIADADALS